MEARLAPLKDMKTLDELINLQEPGWPLVQQWLSADVLLAELLGLNLEMAEQLGV